MLSTGLDRGLKAAVVLLLCVCLGFAMTSCGGSDNNSSKTGSPLNATSSSLIAVDCQRQRAYVPLPDLNGDLHGQVAELDLSVDPDQQNPLVKIIDVGEIALPRAAAVDITTGTVLVLLDNVVSTGVMLLIDESDDSLATVQFPFGSRPSENSGAVINSRSGTALVSMADSPLDCLFGFGSCTGEASFDLATRTFGPVLLTLFEVDSFGVDPSAGVSVGSSDPVTPQLVALNLPAQNTCALLDDNVESLDADPDGIAVDPGTDIWVAGNFQSSTVSVINLRGSTFEGNGSFDCNLNEAGTLPNSVNFDTGAGAEGMPGVAINPVTHHAFMTAQGGNQIALLSLPSSRVKQLSASRIKGVSSSIPNDPFGNAFTPANFPYGNAIDSCNNLGYVVNDDLSFLAQIDLGKFRRKPAQISTPLAQGSCAGTLTTFHCDNGNGVKFFPLFGAPTTAARNLPSQFSREAFRARKAAKQRGNVSSFR